MLLTLVIKEALQSHLSYSKYWNMFLTADTMKFLIRLSPNFRGFTQGGSSINAALILAECTLESQNNKQDILSTALDTQNAFDFVDQSSLLRKLFLDGLQGNDWLLLKDLYSDSSSRIKWAGKLSDPIYIEQGVRQGGVLSTAHYKRYNNPLLLHLEDAYSEIKIGSINTPHITVADDLAVLASKKPTM